MTQYKNKTTIKKDKVEVADNFKKDLVIPNFTISTIKDSTDFNSKDIKKDGLILIKYFSPDCDNCQEEAEIYHSKKDSLKNIRIIWISGEWAQMKAIEEFAKNCDVVTFEFENISVDVLRKIELFTKRLIINLLLVFKK